jgi:hypothetical protein
MLRTSLGVLFILTVASQTARAFEAVGTINKVDADRGVISIHANGGDHRVKVAGDAKILGADGKPLADGLRSRELKEGVEVTVTVEPVDNQPVVSAIRLGRVPRETLPPRTSVGLKPLSEMSGKDRYKGEDGGLYGGGNNEPSEVQRQAAAKAADRIVPRDADGKPASDGRIVLVSISMSNATMEFSTFKRLADADVGKSPHVTVVDCAQGGQTMAQWANPEAKAWTIARERLAAAGVTPAQVQAAWIKLANAGPTGDLHEHGEKLQKDTVAVLHNARARFPNLQIAYLSSRIYGGYASTRLNPEPYAYEGAFVVRWLIQEQGRGDRSLRYDADSGEGIAPLLLWGPYLWGDGLTPRKADGLVWKREDFEGDGTHPSASGRKKVTEMLLAFFKKDPYARTWFVR